MMKYIWSAMMTTVLCISVMIPAFACRVAGSDKHVGQVTSVNTKVGTFTIMDAETRKPIVFTASSDMIKDVEKAQGAVMVSYELSNGKMVAKDIHF